MANEAIATVISIDSSAQARGANGELRVLQVGDTLMQGETLVTPNGGGVELALSDGSALRVADMPEMAITPDLVADTAAGPDESAIEDETVQAVLSALETGQDLGDVVDPTAAGSGGLEAFSGAEEGGNAWVRVGRRALEGTDEFQGLGGSVAAESDANFTRSLVPVEAV